MSGIYPQSAFIGKRSLLLGASSGGSVPTGPGTTWNPADKAALITLSGSNLIATPTVDPSNENARGVAGKTSGKWYFETVFNPIGGGVNDYGGVGVAKSTASLTATYIGATADGWACFSAAAGGGIYNNGAASAVVYAGHTVGQTVMVALDLDNGKLWIGVNGTWPSGGDPAAGTTPAFSGISGTLYPALTTKNLTTLSTSTTNFGPTGFAYTQPSGFANWMA